ncbi:hypothetical protein BH24CHL1_BH24CHL1_09120 [soil metagenome]
MTISRRFRPEAVELVCERSLPQIARELGVTELTLRGWVKRSDIDAGRGAPSDLTTDELKVAARVVAGRANDAPFESEEQILNRRIIDVSIRATDVDSGNCQH